MKRELTRELVDQIIFSMEDQAGEYVLDLEMMEVVTVDEMADADRDDEKRFVPLPAWQSVDGYNLMERFTGTLHNPVFRERLRATLDSGRGVFRQFKDTLRSRPDIEQLWYRYKEREMRALVVEWYADVCDYLGIDYIEPDFAETGDLVQSDFVVRCADGPLELRLAETVQQYDAAALHELFTDYPPDYRGYLERQVSMYRPRLWGEGARVVYAETPGGESAGLLWVQHEELESGRRIGVVVQLFVLSEYRGLGIATTLIETYLQRAFRQGVDRLLMRLPGNCAVLLNSLERIGFDAAVTTMELDLSRWGRARP
ncbi:MAG: GNAT family N-acetyltransferase [Spirochaetaceae bacterium]|nr:MAG: GNAT family N-acetyltransferase [Spirochaetaceae bacterium]